MEETIIIKKKKINKTSMKDETRFNGRNAPWIILLFRYDETYNNIIVHEMERLRQPELNRYYLDLKYI